MAAWFFCKANELECLNLKKLLKKFEEALGECMNLSKLAMLCSSNLNKDREEFLSSILDVNFIKDFSSSLGLPSSLSRSKVDNFKYILDKVNKNFQGQKQNLFSVARREILIKSVGQTLPSYTMSLFHLPKNFFL